MNCAAPAADTYVRPKMVPGDKDIGETDAELPPADDPAASSALRSVW